jgi:hypothetical protein
MRTRCPLATACYSTVFDVASKRDIPERCRGFRKNTFIDVGVTGLPRKIYIQVYKDEYQRYISRSTRAKASLRGPFVEIADCKKRVKKCLEI